MQYFLIAAEAFVAAIAASAAWDAFKAARWGTGDKETTIILQKLVDRSEQNQPQKLQELVGQSINPLLGQFSEIRHLLEEAKQIRLNEMLNQITTIFSEGIAKETMSTKQYSEVMLNNTLGSMQQNIDLLGAKGFDVSGLVKQKEEFAKIAQARIQKNQDDARIDLGNDTRLVEARLSGDRGKMADAQFEITKTQLDRKKKEDARNTDDEAAAEKNYQERLKEAEQQRIEAKRDGQIQEYNMTLQHNELLRDLEGKSQAQIDDLNRKTLDKKIGYLDAELKKADLSKEQIIKLEEEKADALQRLRAIDSRDPKKAYGIFVQGLGNQQEDYVRLMEDSFSRVSSSIEDHFARMLTGAESFSEGFRGIFRSMTNELIQMMVHEFYKQTLLKPLGEWWGGIVSSIIGGNKNKSASDVSAATSGHSLGASIGSIFGASAGIGQAIPKAFGGRVQSSELYYVGENGLEKFVSDHNNTTYSIGGYGPGLFAPPTNGTVVPTEKTGGRGNITISMTINTPDANSFRKSSAQVTDDVARAIRGAMNRL